jgi:hypothetical protein
MTEVTSANTEINTLTDALENPTPLEAPVRDVESFYNRLDSLMEHLETTNAQKKQNIRSFTNQPERVCISSDNDINTSQTQNAVEEQSFSSFKVTIARPFLDVKSIQLLRASIPNAVTNIPDEECTFWYYRLPTATFSGQITITTAPTYTNAAFTLAGVITGTTDTIHWETFPYTLQTAAGVIRGYFAPPAANPGTVSIYSSITLQGATIGSITRSSSLFMPAPAAKYLHMVRLLPSYYKAELFESAFGQDTDLPPNSRYGFNKTFGDYEDLAAELAKSCSADPAYDIATNLSVAFPIFIPNDISLTYNSTLNKFIFTGNNSYNAGNTIKFFSYLSAGYLDPLLWVTGQANSGSDVVSAPTLFDYLTTDFPGDYNYIRSINGQPYQLYRTLNLRLGFTWNGTISQISGFFPINITALEAGQVNASLLAVFLNRLRPVPGYYDTGLLTGPAVGQTSPTTTDIYTADSYANLVFTNTVSLYADFTGGSTYDSMANTQLLACVPMNASNLGVTFYNTTLYCPLTKISDQIYDIEIRMLTDTGLPYVVPNSAIVSLELALTY